MQSFKSGKIEIFMQLNIIFGWLVLKGVVFLTLLVEIFLITSPHPPIMIEICFMQYKLTNRRVRSN